MTMFWQTIKYFEEEVALYIGPNDFVVGLEVGAMSSPFIA